MSEDLLSLTGVSSREIGNALALLERIWNPEKQHEARELLENLIKKHTEVTTLHDEAAKRAGIAEQKIRDLLAAAVKAYEDAEARHADANKLHEDTATRLKAELEAVDVKKAELDKYAAQLAERERALAAKETAFDHSRIISQEGLHRREEAAAKREHEAHAMLARADHLHKEMTAKHDAMKGLFPGWQPVDPTRPG